MTATRRLSLPDFLAAGLLLLYIVAGLFLARDYGVNWDDNAQRENGLVNWRFIHGDRAPLMVSPDRYHGPAWEIALIAAEKALDITEYRNIILLRHQLSFLLYAIGTGIFFLFCRRLFDSSWLGLAGFLMLVLSPRIFGEGFYNPKDTIFLVVIGTAMYSLLLFVTRPGWWQALLHAWVTAFLIDIRVIGIIFIPITLFLLLAAAYRRSVRPGQLLLVLSIYLIAGFLFMLLMWPILITQPFYHLYSAYQQLSNYVAWDGVNLYAGHCVRAVATPWHYHYIWMLVTLPEVYVVLFAIGLILFIANIFRKSLALSTQELFIALSFVLLAFPLIFRSIKGSVVYDGWRHMYFVYPFIVVLAVYAIDRIYRSRSLVIRYAVMVLLGASFIDSAVEIVRRHPFEYVYFNHSAHALYHPVYTSFEMDYWGVGYKQAIEYLLQHHDTPEPVSVSFPHFPGYRNYDMLPPADRQRLIATDTSQSQYYITSYRDYDVCPTDAVQPGTLVHTIYSAGDRIYGIYRLR